jgi:protein-tyrosine phosphatase
MEQLLPVSSMPKPKGLRVPEDAYFVTNSPALLAGMRYPSGGSVWQPLFDLGVQTVICLTDSPARYDPAPLRVGLALRLDDLIHGGPPRDEKREEEAIRSAMSRVLDLLRRGQGVVVHCHGGRGRSGSVLGCVLVGLGHSPDEVISYLNDLHRARGKSGWPESPWQSEIVRRAVGWGL